MSDDAKKPQVRRRALAKQKRDRVDSPLKSSKESQGSKNVSKENYLELFFNLSCNIFGIIGMIIAARYIVWYLEMLHENLFWFSNIKEIEKEISFRTEQGLYYSFYKQLVQATDFSTAFKNLQSDNSTEHGRTINILQRFNIYQEVFLSFVYRYMDLKVLVTPIMFYTKFVFTLQAFYSAGLYLTSWILSRSHLAGILTLCLFIAHKNDASRVDYSVPLRECFSLPFVFCQMAVLTYYLKPTLSNAEKAIHVFLLFVLTFLYTLTWQFAQFISLLQCVILFFLAIVGQTSISKVVFLLFLHFVVLFLVWMLHFGNPMLLTSLLVSFVPFALVVLQIKKQRVKTGVLPNLISSIVYILLTFTLCFAFNSIIKYLLNEGSDSHIFKFVKGKLGLEDPRDFESRVYLCNEAFNFLDVDTYGRLSASALFPFYCITLFLLLSHLVYNTLLRWEFGNSKITSHVDDFAPFAYHAVQSTLFAFLGSTTRRMICLWVPHMCVLGAAGVVSPFIWTSLGRYCNKYAYILRRLAAIILIAYFLNKIIPFVNEQVKDLNEFWDPDTVELMEWIKSKTPETAAFAGSMQLLAGVKLCTARPITNHPHFEDTQLRQRTIQIYQLYGKQAPKMVYDILKQVGASYIILEDSLCLPSDDKHCHIIDIMDLHNGHVPEQGPGEQVGLLEAKHPRFCDQIREGDFEYMRYFKAVFTNKTFRVYKVL